MEEVKKQLNKLLTGFVILMAVLCLALTVKIITGHDASIFGYKMYHILTGSMEPTIKTGSNILVKSVDPDTLQVNDIISFVSRDDAIYGSVNTHRIISIETDENGEKVFITKGDANNAADSIRVRKEDIKGKVVLHLNLTGLGMFYDFLHTGYGFMTVIALPLLVLSWQFLRSFKSQVDELSEEKKKDTASDPQPDGPQTIQIQEVTEEQIRQMNLVPVTKEQYEQMISQMQSASEDHQSDIDKES